MFVVSYFFLISIIGTRMETIIPVEEQCIFMYLHIILNAYVACVRNTSYSWVIPLNVDLFVTNQ